MKKWISIICLCFWVISGFTQMNSKWELSVVYTKPVWAKRYQATEYKLDNGARLALNNVSLNLNRRIIQRSKWRMDVGLGVFNQLIRFENILYYHYYTAYGRCNMYASVHTLTLNVHADFQLRDFWHRANYIRLGCSLSGIQLTREAYSADYYPYDHSYDFDPKNHDHEFGFPEQLYSRVQVDYLFNLLKPRNTEKQKELNVVLGLGTAIVDGNAFNRYFVDARVGLAYRW